MYLEKSAIWSSWLDPQVLNDWSESWLQTLFVANIQQLVRGWDSTSTEDLELASSIIKQRLVINPGCSNATRSVLGLLIALTILVMLFDRRRRLRITFDLSSIALTAAFLAHTESTTKFFQVESSRRFPSLARWYLRSETSNGVTSLQTHGDEIPESVGTIVKRNSPPFLFSRNCLFKENR